MGENFGVRLRRERERLGLTQKEFAEKVGISRMSQVNYESGKRYPGEEYFEALKTVGADAYYLTYGMHIDDINDQVLGAQILIYAIEKVLCLERGDLVPAWEEITHLSADMTLTFDSSVTEVAADHHVKLVLSRSPVLLSEDLLLQVLQGLEEVLIRRGVRITPAKKARIASMLYRHSKASGQLDERAIEDAVTIAAD